MNETSDKSDDQATDRPQPDEAKGTPLRELSDDQLSQIREHQKWLESEGKEGTQADFQQTNLQRRNLYRVELRRANLRGADLRFADLRQASLPGADLKHARLYDCKLRGADLRDADLAHVTGLVSDQLGGADLSGAILPEDIAAFEGLDFIADLSKTARNIFLALVGACVFCWLTIVTTTDVELITNIASSPLPILQTEMPIVWFFWVAPIILFSLYLYFHLYLQLLWKGLGTLPAIFPDGRTLDQRAFPWLLSGIVRAHVKRLRFYRPPLSRLQNLVAVVFAWWIVPLTLVLFWGRYLPKHDWVGSGLHIAILAVSAGFGVLTYLSARAMLRGDNPKPFRLKERWPGPGIYQGATILGTGVVLGILSFASINGERAEKCAFFRPQAWVPAAFKCIGYDVFANLERANISAVPVDWEGVEDIRLSSVTGMELPGVNLRSVRGGQAVLVKANLRNANFQRADLSEADLRKAFLLEADLQDAILEAANLQGAYLFNADLRGANLRRAKLKKAIGLTQQQLDEACGDAETSLPSGLSIKLCLNYRFLEMHEKWLNTAGQEGAKADLGNNNIRGWDLTDANLFGVNFKGADLTGATLKGANLSKSKGLTQEQLDEACGDKKTKLPGVLTIPPCKD